MNEQLSRRDFLRLSAGLAATAMVASCAPKPEPEEGGEEEGGAPEAKRTDFRVWRTWPEEYAACYYVRTKIFPELQEKHSGLEPTQTFVNWRDLTRKFVETKAAGQPPDVMDLEDNEGTFNYLGFVHDLMEPVKSWGVYDDLYEPVKDFCTIQGRLFQYPAYYGTKCHLYNKETFAEVGLDPENPPDNWEDFRDACIKLTKFDASGNMVRAGYKRIKPSHGTYEILSGRFITQNGGHDFDPSDEALGECTINSPECAEAITFAIDLVRRDHVYPLKGGDPWPDEVEDELVEGYLGIDESGPWDMSNFRAEHTEFVEKGLLGVMLPMMGPAGVRSANMDCRGTGVYADSDLLDVAVDFMELYSRDDHYAGQFMSPDPGGDELQKCWMTTGRRSINESPDFWIASEPLVSETAYLPALDYGTSPPRRHVGYVDYMEDGCVRMIEQMLFEIKTDQEILDWLKEKADTIVQRIVEEWE
jgi:ABC-type glycerol-3-phosphate transport system substrate-binding protein